MPKNKKHVFYMEDEELILDHISELLELENCRVTKSVNAKEALDKIDVVMKRKEHVDIFLLDIIIFPWEPFTPEETFNGFLTGLRVADQIMEKYIGINDNYKIVFATAAYGTPGKVKESVRKYLGKNRDRCVLVKKPIDFSELKGHI